MRLVAVDQAVLGERRQDAMRRRRVQAGLGGEDFQAGRSGLAGPGVHPGDGPGDDPRHHLTDTLIAGAGLCDPDAVRVLVEEGPTAVAGLLASGAAFDRTADGALSYTLEGGHSWPRIVHAGGDATGLEIQRTLESAVMAADDVQVWERTFLLDLLTAMVREEASDLFLIAGAPPTVRRHGEYLALKQAVLSGPDIQAFAASVTSAAQAEVFETRKECDLALQLPGTGRFRVNLHMQLSLIHISEPTRPY